MYKYTYNGDGNVNTFTDFLADEKSFYTYDPLGRLLNKTLRSINGIQPWLRSVSYKYDTYNRVSRVDYKTPAFNYYEQYTYNNDDGSLNTFRALTGDAYSYTYDGLKRLSNVSVAHENNSLYTFHKKYQYTDRVGNTTLTSTLPYTLTYDYTNAEDFYSMPVYNSMGKIQSFRNVSGTETDRRVYTYDELGQLTEERLANLDLTYKYYYDNAGNIQKWQKVMTSTGLVLDEGLYEYTDAGWSDLLTAYDGYDIIYSGVGLPDYIPSAISTRYDQELEWDAHGKLAWASSSAGGNVYFTYDANGQRLTKTSGGVLHEYFYEGTRLLYETFGNNKLIYLYDESGSIEAFLYNGTKYYLVKNLQGDVVQLRNKYNQVVAHYTYNAFGYLLSVTDASGNEITDATNIALINPIRYRGYYYDNETKWYYLNSRYYNPEMGRFVSADAMIAGISDSVKGYNLFAYCFNDPVNMTDESGNWPKWLTNAVNWVANALGITTSTGSVATTGSSAMAKGPTISRNTSLGIVSSKASGSLGNATGSFRGQATQSDSGSNKSMIGGFGKASALSVDSQNRIGTQNVGISKKDVLDVGTATAQAGVQYKDGLGISLVAKASVAAARGTYCVDIFGWKFEVGMSAQFLSYGYEFAYGALPEGGWGVKKGASTGTFGYTYLIRITPH